MRTAASIHSITDAGGLMKLTHRVPTPQPAATVALSERYQAEVDASSERLAKRLRDAERAEMKARLRLEQAERRAAVSTSQDLRREHRIALELYALRLAELERLHSQMVSHAQPATNRGRKGFRPIPQPKAF